MPGITIDALVYEALRQNPDDLYIHPSGKVLIALANPETDQFLAIKAEDGVNFLTWTDEKINQHICQVLSEF